MSIIGLGVHCYCWRVKMWGKDMEGVNFLVIQNITPYLAHIEFQIVCDKGIPTAVKVYVTNKRENVRQM